MNSVFLVARTLTCLVVMNAPSSAPTQPASAPAAANALDVVVIPNPAFEAARQRGDADAALRVLADHFTSRPRLTFGPSLFGTDQYKPRAAGSYVYDQADDVLNNRFAFVYRYVSLGPDFEWNSLYGTDEPEIAWWVNRFFYLECLQDAHEPTRDRKYPRHGVDLMLDWIRENPAARADQLWAAWRPLEVGLRLANWSAFVDHFARERIIEPRELAAILASIREQMDYLAARSGPGRGNHGVMEQTGLAVAALTFPEIRGADKHLARALEVLKTDMARQVYPDGSHEEMSPHYETTVILAVEKVLHVARQRKTNVPADLVDALKRAAQYLARIRKPDGTLPMLNDGDAIDFSPALVRLAEALDLHDVGYIMGREPAMKTSPGPLQTFPHAGVTVFRDSWKPDARYLLFEYGPFGTAHQHEDANLIEVSAFGRDFIVDPGRYTYVDGPMRQYFIGTQCHATVRVDGGDQTRRAHPETWRQDQPLDRHFWKNREPGVPGNPLYLALGNYTTGYAAPQYAGVNHHREVMFVHDTYWVVSDVLLGSGRHRIEQNFQYVPCELDVRSDRVLTRLPDANLAVLWHWPGKPDVQIRTGRKDPPAGWYSPIYGQITPAPLLTLSAEIELPARIMLVVYPYRGASPPELALGVMPMLGTSLPDAGGLVLTHDEVKDTVLMGLLIRPAKPPEVGGHVVPSPRVVISRGVTTVIEP